MPLQNFVARSLPTISAAWLNMVDTLKFTIFADSTTKAQARAALTSDAPFSIPQGGSGGAAMAFSGADSGAVNAAVVTLSGAATGFSRLTGVIVTFTATATNTGPATLNVNGTGAAAVINELGNALTGGELSTPVSVIWTGVAWRLVAVVISYRLARQSLEVANGVFPTRYNFECGDIRRYCTAAATNHQTAFDSAHLSSNVIYFPDSTESPTGTWNVDHCVMNVAGKTVKTDGFSTVVHQRTGNINRRIFEVQASNITIESIKLTGNIATEAGVTEQQHGIFVRGSGADITNISIGDVIAQDIAGDGVYVGGTGGFNITNIKIGMVQCNNVLRNGVALTGCRGVKIAGIEGAAIGYTTVDMEPDTGTNTVIGVEIGYIKGKTIGIQGQSSTQYVDQVVIHNLDLNTSYTTNSTPPYASSLGNNDGIVLRNAKSVSIGNCRLRNYNRYGMSVVFNIGELGVESLIIGSLDIATCSITDAVNNNYLNLANTARLNIGSVTFDVTGTAKRLFFNLNGVSIIEAAVGTLATGCMMFRSCGFTHLQNFNVTGGTLVNSNVDKKFFGSVGIHDGENLYTNGDNGSFVDVTATESVALFTGGKEHHSLVNCTLNGSYTANGLHQGKGNFTMGAAAAKVVNNTSITAGSKVILTPTNAAAGTLMGGTKSLYVSALTVNTSFTVTTADGTAAAGTETFNYVVTE